MYKTLQTILPSILEIIQFRHNRQEFIQTFLQQCRQITVLGLINSLPKEKQEELKKRIAHVTSGKEGKEIILSYFPTQVFENALDKTAQSYFQEYIEDILPKLAPGIKYKLQVYVGKLQ